MSKRELAMRKWRAAQERKDNALQKYRLAEVALKEAQEGLYVSYKSRDKDKAYAIAYAEDIDEWVKWSPEGDY